MFNNKKLKEIKRDINNLTTLFDDMMKHYMILKDKVKKIDDEVFRIDICDERAKSKLYYLVNDIEALKNYLDVDVVWHYEDDPRQKKPEIPQIVVWEAIKKEKNKNERSKQI